MTWTRKLVWFFNAIARSFRGVCAVCLCLGACVPWQPRQGEAAESLALLVFSRANAKAEAECKPWHDEAGVLPDASVAFSVRHFLSVKADTPESTFPSCLSLYRTESTNIAATGGARTSYFKAPPANADAGSGSSADVALVYSEQNRLVHAREVPGSSPPARVAGKTELKTYALMVMVNYAPGQEAAFNQWYDAQHVPDVLRIPGFFLAQRYRLHSVETPGVAVPPYMILFTFESYDLEATIADLKQRVRSGVTKMSPAFGTGGHVYYYLVLDEPKYTGVLGTAR